VNRRTYIRVLLCLLPLVVARAFIPSGFMLGQASDGFGLMVCSGTMPAAPHHQHSEHGDHSGHASHNHYEADSGHHSHGESDSSACPFAIGACAASIDIPHLASLSTPSVDEQSSLDTIPASGIATPRSHPIRGPPRST